MASCRQGRHQASNQNSTGFGLKNFFRAPPARLAGKPMGHSYRYWLRFGTRSGCQNFRASFQGFSKTSKRRTEAYRMHVGTDFLKLPPVTGQYWSLFQCSMLGTGVTCEVVLQRPSIRAHSGLPYAFCPIFGARTQTFPVMTSSKRGPAVFVCPDTGRIYAVVICPPEPLLLCGRWAMTLGSSTSFLLLPGKIRRSPLPWHPPCIIMRPVHRTSCSLLQSRWHDAKMLCSPCGRT